MPNKTLINSSLTIPIRFTVPKCFTCTYEVPTFKKKIIAPIVNLVKGFFADWQKSVEECSNNASVVDVPGSGFLGVASRKADTAEM